KRPVLLVSYPPIPPFSLGWTFIDDLDVRLAGPRAYVLAYGGILGVFDISNTGLPTLLASTNANRDSANGLEIIGREIFVTGRSATEVFELRNRTNLVRLGYGPSSVGVRKNGTNLFFAAGDRGLTIAGELHVPYFTLQATTPGGGGVVISPFSDLYR